MQPGARTRSPSRWTRVARSSHSIPRRLPARMRHSKALHRGRLRRGVHPRRISRRSDDAMAGVSGRAARSFRSLSKADRHRLLANALAPGNQRLRRRHLSRARRTPLGTDHCLSETRPTTAGERTRTGHRRWRVHRWPPSRRPDGMRKRPAAGFIGRCRSVSRTTYLAPIICQVLSKTVGKETPFTTVPPSRYQT